MAIREIVQVVEPPLKDRSYRGGLFRIWHPSPSGKDYCRDVHKLTHDRLVFEQEMLHSKGISEFTIEKYKKLLRAEIQEDHEFEPTYCPICGN